MKIFVLILAVLFAHTSFAANETFKMYERPNEPVNTDCDLYTQLELNTFDDQATAKVSQKVFGTCQINVPSTVAVYPLSLTIDSCGAKVYSTAEEAEDVIKIVDNRTNFCEIVIPALIVLTKYTVNGETTLYSQDRN